MMSGSRNRVVHHHSWRQVSVTFVTIAALIASSVAAQTPRQSGAAASRARLVARLDSTARAASRRVPSIAVAVLRGRDTLLLSGYGLADRERGVRATPNTIYEIASLTKQVTASAIMRLVERGALHLDDDVGQFVQQFPRQGRHVTVEELLTHTSGIHNFTDEPYPETGTDRHDAVLQWIAAHPFDFAPGTKVAYSNTGYTLLGMIIEKVSGRSFAAFVDQEFFRPLGLQHTRYCDSHPGDSTMARGYRGRDTGYVPTQAINMEIPFAAGAICSSVADYAMWERAFLEGRVVSPASFRRMTAPDTLQNGTVAGGFGLQVGTLGDHGAFTHGGGITGFESAEIVLPRDSVVVVVFANVESQYPTTLPLAFDLARMVVGYAPNGFGALDRPGHVSRP